MAGDVLLSMELDFEAMGGKQVITHGTTTDSILGDSSTHWSISSSQHHSVIGA